jgi:hypothetical protein
MSGPGPQTLAYLAGVMDGEGCISIRRTKARPNGGLSTRYSVSVTVGNTNRDLIAVLVSAFGVGSVTYRYATRRKRACYLWALSSGGAQTVLEALLPYLVIKRQQAAVVLEFIEQFDSHKGGRPGAFGARRVGESELARRAALYEEIRILNRVGNPDQLGLSPNGKMSVGITAAFRVPECRASFDLDRFDTVADPDALHNLDS